MDKQQMHFEKPHHHDLMPAPSALNLVDLSRTEMRHKELGGATSADALKMLDGFSIADNSKPLVKHQFSSDAELRSACINAIPAAQYNEFQRAGYDIKIVNDIEDFDKQMGTHHATEKPEGYRKGLTWKNTDVFFDPDHKLIGICKNFVPPDAVDMTAKVRTDAVMNIPARFRHEFGHALDQIRNFPMQNSGKLQQLYSSESKTASTSADAPMLGYYLQPGAAGLRETIAGLYSIEHGGGTDPAPIEEALKNNFRPMLKFLEEHKF